MIETDREHAHLARQAWSDLCAKGTSGESPLWGALKAVKDSSTINVFDRAAELLESRQVEMERRCEPALGSNYGGMGYPGDDAADKSRDAVVSRSDARAMQTIVASYADALDQINAVLETMIGEWKRRLDGTWADLYRAQRSIECHFQDTEQALAGPNEDIQYMDNDARERIKARLADLENARQQYARAAGELAERGERSVECCAARVEVMAAWKLTLECEAKLAKIAG